jgi:hypothetical protein
MIRALRQRQGYHHFADRRGFMGLDNFADVASNLAFVAAGLAGLLFLWQHGVPAPGVSFADEYRAYCAFFAAVVLVGFGSAYYHLAPDDARLAWDRLPIAVAFVCLLAGVASERLGIAGSWKSIGVLAALGAASVLYWRLFDDLRPYVLVQFGSLGAIVLVCSRFPSHYTQGWAIFGVAALYAVAKLCESYDRQIFALTQGAVSGHTLKHLMAASAVAALLAWLVLRQPLSAGHG